MKLQVLALLLAATTCLASVSSKIESIAARKELTKVKIAVTVLDAQTGRAMCEYNSTTPLVPASTMKLVTSTLALEKLGWDYKFTTTVAYNGSDVIVRGSGDPLLGMNKDIISEISRELKDITANVRNILVDSTIFDDELQNKNWPAAEINRSYQPEVCGINYRLNCVSFNVWPEGSATKWSTEPASSCLSVSNKSKYTSSHTNTVWASRSPDSNDFTIYGNCGFKALPFEVPVHRPAVFFGVLLAEKLLSDGISVTGSVIEGKAADGKILTSFDTPIEAVVIEANTNSLNLAAECLAKAIAAKSAPAGNWTTFSSTAQGYAAKYARSDAEAVIVDGSGLSRANRLSTNVIAGILYDESKSAGFERFKKTLAVGGVNGSGPVSRYFKDPKCRGRIFAKSGTLTGVKALAGYCETDSGDYVFSIITNNANGATRIAINDIVISLFD